MINYRAQIPQYKEQVTAIAKRVCEQLLSDQTYAHSKTQSWNDEICRITLRNLQDIENTHYKYIVSSVLTEKTEHGLHMSKSCYWDSETDYFVSFHYENKSLHAIVTIFAVAFSWPNKNIHLLSAKWLLTHSP